MSEELKRRNALVFSYLSLRKAIGLLGTSFPLLLFLGAVIVFQQGLQDSISRYYHTGMRDVFVGTLCVIGFFLLSYKGYERTDDVAGDLGCLFAVGVALFPTRSGDAALDGERWVGYIHFVFAALFFLTLIYFSLCLFTKTDPERNPTPRKRNRNMVYKVCGCAMGVCMALIVVYHWLPEGVEAAVAVVKPVFWLEAIAIVAFGISWMTKGEIILKDQT